MISIKNASRIAALLVTLARANAASFYVDDALQFNARVDKFGASFATLSAGDRVFLKGGSWAGLITTLTGSMSDVLAQSNPAIIQACDSNYNPTIGGVTITGLSQIQLAGSGIILSGVTFGPTSGMFKRGLLTDYGGNDSTAYIIQFNGLSRYMTVSHVKFDYCGRDNTDYSNNDHYGGWLHLNGYRHTVQYCEFQGRDFNPADIDNPNPAARTSIRQATVIIYKDSADTVDWGYHTLRYNYFGERKIPLGDDLRLYTPADGSLPSDLSNGWETIRVGNSSFVEVDFNTTVEYNVFYHSIQSVDGGATDPSGEPEMISNKSRKNSYRYNTILNNYGHLCLRQGDYCVVQGNYFLSGGVYNSSGNIILTEARNDRMGGVRAFGFGHVISNNYFYKISGDGIHSAICIGSGITETGTLAGLLNGNGAAGYETANFTQILSNTFIDCHAITLDNSNGQIYPVYGTRFHNNLIHYGSNIGAVGIIGNADALTNHGGLATGNWVYSSNSTQRNSASTMLGTAKNTISGSAANDPQMTGTYDTLTIPSATSPLIGQADSPSAVTDSSSTRASYDLAGNVAIASGVDMRALSRPALGRDVGSYEREAGGDGVRPLRRFEVGRVPAAYPVGPILAEGFPSSTRTTQNPPNSAKWFSSSLGTNVGISSGSMTVNTSAARHMVAHFPAVSLALGDALNLSFSFSVTSPADVPKGIRVGLLYGGTAPKFTADNQNPSVDYSGYGSLINPAPTAASPVTLQKRGGSAALITSVETSWVDINSGAPIQSLSPGTVYQGVLAIRRITANQTSITSTYTGGALSNCTVTGMDASNVYSTFDTVAFAVGTSSGIPAVSSISYSNILISKVTPLIALPGSASGTTNQVIDIDLQPLVSNSGSPFKPLTFSISSATNGSATILSDRRTARFTPDSGFVGTTDFNYSVSDGITATNAAISLIYSATPAMVTINGLARNFDGNPKEVAASTIPQGLATSITYSGLSTAPSAVGSYSVTVTVTEPGYVGSATGIMVISKGVATITLANLIHAFDGTLKAATALTNPPGKTVNLSYSGSAVEVGSYPVTATMDDINYSGFTTGFLTITPLVVTFTSPGSNTWTCPTNVKSIQVECWGGGGSGGSARRGNSSAATGGGGAGGAYAKLYSYFVIPGTTYFLSIGDGGASSSSDGVSVAGGNSWINSSNSPSSILLARGGAGGASAVTSNSDKYGIGGIGTATGSLGDAINAGGSGSTSSNTNFGGGGGGSGGIGYTSGENRGSSAIVNSGSGAAAVSGGGNGGNPNTTSGNSSNGQSPTIPPGGGGGGARSASSIQRTGGNGAPGQIVLTLNVDSVVTVPDPPTDIAVTAGNSCVSVRFIPPVNNGGASITDFTVTASPGGATTNGTASPLTVTGLSNGISYTFTVTATNSIGAGAPSSSSPEIIPATIPTVSMPFPSNITGTTAALGNGIADDGGSPITERGIVYSETSTNGNPQLGGAGVSRSTASASIGSFSMNLSDLAPGVTYSFAAYAVNSMGITHSMADTFTTLSNDASLLSLTLSAGSLNPVFSSGTTFYTIFASNDVGATTVSPTKNHRNATIAIKRTSDLSDNAGAAIPLNVGSNSIATVVTAQDGSTNRTYTVTVIRQSATETWRHLYFNTFESIGQAAENADPDGDGLSNSAEYVFGSNPTASDALDILTVGSHGGEFSLTFIARQASGTGYAGLSRYYTVEFSTYLTNPSVWTALAGYSDRLAANQLISIVPPKGETKYFYRLKVRIE